MLPPWLAPIVAGLPLWVQWLLPGALQVVVNYFLPILLKAFPAQAQLIKEFIAFLTGKPMSPSMHAALNHYHQLKALEKPEVAESAEVAVTTPPAEGA